MNGKCSDYMSEDVGLDFAVEMDGECVGTGEGDAL